MFKHILFFSATLLITFSFISCSKDENGAIKIYAYADINSVAYKDFRSIYDVFNPYQPVKPTLFNGDRLGVYNDSIFVFQFMFRSVQGQKELWLFGAFLVPKGEAFPKLNRPYQLSKNLAYDKDGTSFEDFLKYLPVSDNNNTDKGIAVIIDYNQLSSATSIDGTITFKNFDSRTLSGDIYLNSNGKLPIPYKIEGHFSDVLSYNKI